MAHPGGRPTTFNPEIGKELCEIIATTRKSVRKLCAEHDLFPGEGTFFRWLIHNKEFSEQYALARKHKVAMYMDDIIDIADDSSNDKTINADGKEITNNEAINRSRLRIEARKWTASKEFPQVYGDKVINENHTTIGIADKTKENVATVLKEY